MRRFWIILGLAVLTASPANAHPGDHVFSLQSGLLHPLSGIDHLLAILACGLCAARIGGAARWWLPGAFLGAMALGAVLGQGADGNFVEIVVGLSVVVFGLALLIQRSPPLAVAGMIAAGFGLAHGYAHGAEVPVTASALLYGAGFLISTAGLLAFGVALGRAGDRACGAMAIRISGGLIATIGMFVLAS